MIKTIQKDLPYLYNFIRKNNSITWRKSSDTAPEKMLKRFILIFIGIISFNAPIFSQVQQFRKQQLNADLDTLYSIVQEIHPDMFTVISKIEFEKKIEEVKHQINDSMSRLEFYKLIAPLVVSIGDGHTSMYLPREDLDSIAVKYFPYAVSIDYKAQNVMIEEDRSKSFIIPVGAIILKINNKPIERILSDMYHYTSGEQEFFKASFLKYTFTPLLFTIYHDTSFLIEYKYDNAIKIEQVQGIPRQLRYPQNNNKQSNQTNQICSLKVKPDSSIAIITINSFTDDGHWGSFFDSAFSVIKELKINDLIINIRQNGGGNSSLGDLVFQYISPVNYRQFGKTIIKTSKRQVEFHKKFYNMEQQCPFGIMTAGDNTELVKLNENPLRFNGNKYLLISNYTYSSAASFSWAFKYFNMGKVIGEESGGMAVCFGDIIMQSLPNTNLQFQVSHKKFYHYGATDQDTSGTIPDYEIPSDKAVDFTIELIMNTRRNY